MKTRRSWRNQEILWCALGGDKAIKFVETQLWLDMTDAEIDCEYFHFGKTDRTRMKKQAAQERLRLQVQAVLTQEKGI